MVVLQGMDPLLGEFSRCRWVETVRRVWQCFIREKLGTNDCPAMLFWLGGGGILEHSNGVERSNDMSLLEKAP
jgi:hypothetical protein